MAPNSYSVVAVAFAGAPDLRPAADDVREEHASVAG